MTQWKGNDERKTTSIILTFAKNVVLNIEEDESIDRKEEEEEGVMQSDCAILLLRRMRHR